MLTSRQLAEGDALAGARDGEVLPRELQPKVRATAAAPEAALGAVDRPARGGGSAPAATGERELAPMVAGTAAPGQCQYRGPGGAGPAAAAEGAAAGEEVLPGVNGGDGWATLRPFADFPRRGTFRGRGRGLGASRHAGAAAADAAGGPVAASDAGRDGAVQAAAPAAGQ
ncbi:hypothetical protein CHLRE_10g439026v5 [Chlamydomonas reinhardtii]|uniref:Uncharacterized protein n=1 Tax=Chlamydomonas reinhardtii TaxID=3055 RepID=A0A2K3DAE1_CHLRE|nr:uncharacterized protein CHLRE_10g439026v5 [Chlamydomonas reinhardtii]PNW77494.1 hypothetical protein CHLRE_10g439026v5 [Chlamydomonas reinhardtii]